MLDQPSPVQPTKRAWIAAAAKRGALIRLPVPSISDEKAASWRPLIVLLLLTLLAGGMRFFRLSTPTIWSDESMVFRRICGTYAQLLECLRTDGFVPLHYEMNWVMSRWIKVTPTALRFVPALCGTLMVPAMYFLARQLLPQATSLLAAAFTACSAFMCFYSRDAKMYMDAWLFLTLNAGCLLWWFRSRLTTAWLCWIASGCAACGLQPSSPVFLGLSLLFLFSQRKMRWQQTVLWLVGVTIILSGPIGYYEKFNVWKDRVEDDGWQTSGLSWIVYYNYGRTGPELVRCLGTSFLMGWEWPKPDTVRQLQPERFAGPSLCAQCALVILIIALLPWPRRWRGISPLAPTPQPQWRVLLWLSLWIVLPVYGFYCRSMPNFTTPADWWQWTITTFPSLLLPVHHHWIWWLIGMLIIALLVWGSWDQRLRPAMLRALALVPVVVGVLAICWGMGIAAAAMSRAAADDGRPWESLWVPRYIGFVWPAVALAIAALLMRLPTRTLRITAIIFFLAVNLGVGSFRVFGHTEPPVDLMAHDVFEGSDAANHTLAWMHIYRGDESPGSGSVFTPPGEYYLELLQNSPTSPQLFSKSLRARYDANRWRAAVPRSYDLPADLKRVIIWSQFAINDSVAGDEFLRLNKGWKLQSESNYVIRDCWVWQDLVRYRRRVYVRDNPPQSL